MCLTALLPSTIWNLELCRPSSRFSVLPLRMFPQYFRYFDDNDEKEPLMQYLCRDRVLKNDSVKSKCLSEKLVVEDKNKNKDEL